MKRFVTFFVLMCLTISAGAQYRALQQLTRSETGAAFEEHIQYLSSAMLEGRKAGSEGEKEAAKYMTEQFEAVGLDVLSDPEGDLFGIKQESGDTLTSRNVMAFVKGYEAGTSDHYIVIGARLDNHGTSEYTVDGEKRTKTYYGANGNASGLAMLIELGRKLSTNRVLLRRSVVLVAFGSSLETNAGSWYFLHRSFSDPANIDAMINLDMIGTGSNGFYAYTSVNSDMDAIVNALAETLQPVKPELVNREPVRSDHGTFYDAEIPSILFTTGMYPEYNSDRDTADIIEYDEMDRELEYLYNFTVKLANGPKPEFRPSLKPRKGLGPDGVVSYADCDYKPTFLGSANPSTFLQKWVYVYLKYPEKAVHDGIQGKVLVDFIIDEKGKVTNVRVLKGAHPLLDDEAVRVVEASPNWKPGRVRGEKVKTEMSIYVEFRLEKKKK